MGHDAAAPYPSSRALVLLTALVFTLHWLARFDLRGPTGPGGEEVSAWLDDPVIVVATVCRWLALAAGWYLIVVVAAVGILGAPSSETGWRRLVPTPVVGSVGALLGLTAVVLPTAAHLHGGEGTSAGAVSASTLRMDNVTPLSLTPEEPLASVENGAGVHPLSDAGVAPTPLEVASASIETTDVRPGDSFWSLAEEHLEDSWGRRQLADAEIVPYWRALIDANLAELTDPDNPDLLLPGQRLVLPDAPPDPTR